MSTTIDGIRIVDLPDLGVFTSDSSIVGEHAGSGRFSAAALSNYYLPLSGGNITGPTTVTLHTSDLAPHEVANAFQSTLITSGSTPGFGYSSLARVTATGGTTAANRYNQPNIAMLATPIKYIPAGGLPAGTTQLQDQWAFLGNSYDCSNSPSSIGGTLTNEYDTAANGRDDGGARNGAQYIFTTLWPVGPPGPDNPYYGPTPTTGGWPVEFGVGMLLDTGLNAVIGRMFLPAGGYNTAVIDCRQAYPYNGAIQSTVAAGGTSLHVSGVVGYMTWGNRGINFVPVSPTNPMPVTIGANTYGVIGAVFDAASSGGVTTDLGTLTLSSGIIGTDGAAGNTVTVQNRTIWLADNQQISWSTDGSVCSFSDSGSLYIRTAANSFVFVESAIQVGGSVGIGGEVNILGVLDMGSLGAPSAPQILFHSSGHSTSDASISSQGGSATANTGTMLLAGAVVQVTNGLLGFSPIPTNAANDGAAATAGVPVGTVYRNGSVLQVRVS